MKRLLFMALGMAVGAGVSYILTKKHYEKLIDERFREEINAMKKEQSTTEKEDSESMNEELIKDYIGDEDEEDEEEDEESEEDDILEPEDKDKHVITYDDFVDPDYDYYTKIGMTFYSDGILVDDSDEKRIYRKAAIDILGVAPEKFNELFGEDDSFYIRDNGKRVDYEIIRDEGEYLEENYDKYYDEP